MNFLLEGILIIVSSTAPVALSGNEYAVAVYNHDDHKIYVMPEYKKEPFVLYHEIGHYKFHKYFIGQGAFEHAMFWINVNKQTKYCPSGTMSWEIVADHYAFYRLGKEMPPEVVAYFTYYK